MTVLAAAQLPAPVGDFLQPSTQGMLEQANPVARVLKLVNVGPHLCLPTLVVGGGLSAGRAPGVKLHRDGFGADRSGPRQLYKDAAHFLDLLVGSENMLVAQKVSEA